MAVDVVVFLAALKIVLERLILAYGAGIAVVTTTRKTST
jgi:hypothetical protein